MSLISTGSISLDSTFNSTKNKFSAWLDVCILHIVRKNQLSKWYSFVEQILDGMWKQEYVEARNCIIPIQASTPPAITAHARGGHLTHMWDFSR